MTPLSCRLIPTSISTDEDTALLLPSIVISDVDVLQTKKKTTSLSTKARFDFRNEGVFLAIRVLLVVITTSASLAQLALNAALKSLEYEPDEDWCGHATIQLVADDLGSFARGTR